jgi:hypothetical protein
MKVWLPLRRTNFEACEGGSMKRLFVLVSALLFFAACSNNYDPVSSPASTGGLRPFYPDTGLYIFIESYIGQCGAPVVGLGGVITHPSYFATFVDSSYLIKQIRIDTSWLEDNGPGTGVLTQECQTTIWNVYKLDSFDVTYQVCGYYQASGNELACNTVHQEFKLNDFALDSLQKCNDYPGFVTGQNGCLFFVSKQDSLITKNLF